MKIGNRKHGEEEENDDEEEEEEEEIDLEEFIDDRSFAPDMLCYHQT